MGKLRAKSVQSALLNFVAAVFGLCNVSFKVYKWMDFDIDVSNGNEFVS